jgi:PAS domain S-box-containing protein
MMSQQKPLQALPAIGRYAAAVLSVVCTLAIRLVLDPTLGDRAPFLFFVLMIVVVKRLWGRGPGLLAALLGGIAAWYFIIELRFSFVIAHQADAFNLAAYFAIGASISFLGEGSPSSLSVRGRNINVRVFRQTAVLAGAAVVLAGMVLLLLRDFQRAQDAEGWVVHTYRVINSTESLMSMMKDAETGERGYLLTGDESYLGPYNSAIAALPRGLKELKDLTSDNPSQQARWVDINRLTDERLSILKRAIELRKASQVDAALTLVRTGEGVQAMDDLRSTLDAVMSEERDLLAERTAEAENRASRGRWVLGLGSGALVLLLVFASVAIERETVRREEITRALRRHADLLEQAHDSLLICQLSGPIGYWNRGAETLFGYTREEAVGRSSHELLQTYHPLGMAQIDAILERDGQWRGELTQTTKDGRKLIVEGHWTVATDAKGNKTVLEANRDITERKRAEGENLLLATAIEQAAETVVITDRNAKIQYVNPAFTCTTGYTRDEALGQNPRVLKSGQHDAKFYQELWATLAAGKLWQGEFTNRRKDGTLYREEATVAPVRDASGEITNYIAIKSDITERQRAEMALRESEMMLRFFVQHAPAAIAMLDREMRYLVVSQRWMTDFQLGDRDIRGLHHYEVFPDLPEHWKEIHRKCLEGAVERCPEDAFLRPGGKIEWVSREVRPWRKADDSIGGIIIFSELITERKRTEEALKQHEYLLRESQRVGRIGSYELDFASGRWSSSAIQDEIFGIGSDYLKDVAGWQALVHPDQREEMSAYFEQITAERKRFERDYRIVRPSDGAERWVSGKGELVLDGQSRPRKMIGTIQDITERKHAEEELHLLNIELEERVRSRTSALEAANKELEAFAHSVSHDLRAPLRGIDGWSLALLEDYGEHLDAQGHKYLDRVRSEAQRMGRLIDDLLHLSRVSRTELVPSTVDLTSLAETIVARLKEAHPGRAIEFIVARQLKSTGDARLLEIALTNLLDNAVKFTGPCNPARVEFGQTECEGSTAFFIRDNGVGFDMAYAGMLFAPFQRLHKASEFPGTGIGLATVQRVINRHGGRIWAEARVGAGATLFFTLGANKR